VITGCPLSMIAPDVAELLAASDMAARHGVLPVGGGMLDQAAVFAEGHAVVQAEFGEHKAEAMRAAQRRAGVTRGA
jgi:hypothetical protein